MKIMKPTSRLRAIIIVGCIIFIALVALFFYYIRSSLTIDTSTNVTSTTDLGQKESNTQPDKAELSPSDTPSVAITDLKVTSSNGSISYIASVAGATSRDQCILTVSNETGRSLSTTVQSSKDACSAELRNSEVTTGSSWALTLRYINSGSESVIKKAVTIQ